MTEGSPPQPVEEADLLEKAGRLHGQLAGYQSLLVAFSGGADSAYLAWAATAALGSSVLCVTADSPSYPDHHRQLARRVAREFGLRHEIIHTSELERPEYRANPVNRCYYCKHELYTVLTAIARAHHFAVIADGSNADDRGDYRPGRQAAREFGVSSPLDDVGLTKAEIRELSRRAGLPTWDEPASACLSSRIPYHTSVTNEKLRMIERAEDRVRSMGFRVCRVRHHDLEPRFRVTADGPADKLAVDLVKGLGMALLVQHERMPRVHLRGANELALGDRPRHGAAVELLHSAGGPGAPL